MTLFTNAWPTYSAIGNREDLSPVIYMIAPYEAPVLANLPATKAAATLHEWQTQALASAAANAQLEGDNITSATAATASVRRGNYCQISRKAPSVTGTQNAVNKAGREDEMEYQVYLKSLELIRDMETDITSNTARVAGNTTTARVSAGLGAWIATNDVVQSGGTSPTGDGTDTRGDAGTQVAFSESNLGLGLQRAYAQGGNPSLAICGPFNKRQMSATLTGAASRWKDAEDKTIVGAVDVFVSDFGKISVIPDRFSRERDLWLLDPAFAAIAYLRPFHVKELASTGDYEFRLLQVEYCLEMRQEAAHSLVADLTSS